MKQAAVMIGLFLLLLTTVLVIYGTNVLGPGTMNVSDVTPQRSADEEQRELDERIARAKARKEAKEAAAAGDSRDPFTREMEKLGEAAISQAFAEGDPVCTQEDLDKWTSELVPIIEEVTTWRFKKPPVVKAADRAMLVDSLEQDIINSPGNNWTGSGSARIYASLQSAMLLGLYGVTTKEAYIAVTNVEPLMRYLNIDRARSKDLVRLVLAHELTHVLQDHVANMRNQIVQADVDGNRQLALHAVVEGHAMLIEELIAERLGLSDLLQEMNGLYRNPPQVSDSASVGDMLGVLRGQISFCYIDGRDFMEHHLEAGGHDKLNWVLFSPPRDPMMILNPPAYDGQVRALPLFCISERLKSAIIARGFTDRSSDDQILRATMNDYPPQSLHWLDGVTDGALKTMFVAEKAGFVFVLVLRFRNTDDPARWQQFAMEIPHRTKAFFDTRDEGELKDFVDEPIAGLEAANGRRVHYIEEFKSKGKGIYDISFSTYERVGIYVLIQGRFATPEFHRRVHEDVQQQYRHLVYGEPVDDSDEPIDLTNELLDPPYAKRSGPPADRP